MDREDSLLLFLDSKKVHEKKKKYKHFVYTLLDGMKVIFLFIFEVNIHLVDLKLKGKFYRVAVRPTLLYGSECWPLRKVQERKLETTEMRMLRWICGRTMMDQIPNEVFRRALGVENISKKVREGRLRWFWHVRRRWTLTPVRRVESISVGGKRKRGRPRRTWTDQLRLDMQALNLTGDMTLDRAAWRRYIRVTETVS